MENEKPEYILCAAIHYDDGKEYGETEGLGQQPGNIETGFVITGRRHHNCYELLWIMQKCFGSTHDRTKCGSRHNQGFITSKNRYVGRVEAYQIAKANNQLLHNLHDKENPILVSEDLY